MVTCLTFSRWLPRKREARGGSHKPPARSTHAELRIDHRHPHGSPALPQAAIEDGTRLVIVDARAHSDYFQAHIPGALSVPSYDVDEYAARLPKDGTWIVAYCACPHAASGRVAAALRDRGFKNVVVLDEGVGTARIDADPWGLREAVPRSS